MSIIDRSHISYLKSHFEFFRRSWEDTDPSVGCAFTSLCEGLEREMKGYIPLIEAFLFAFIDIDFSQTGYTAGPLIESRMLDYYGSVKKKTSFSREWLNLDLALDSFRFNYKEKFTLLLGSRGYTIPQSLLRGADNWHLHDEDEGPSYRLNFFIRDKILQIFKIDDDKKRKELIRATRYLNLAEVFFLLLSPSSSNSCKFIQYDVNDQINPDCYKKIREIFPCFELRDHQKIPSIVSCFLGNSTQLLYREMNYDTIQAVVKYYSYTVSELTELYRGDRIKVIQFRHIISQIPGLSPLRTELIPLVDQYYESFAWIYYSKITPEFKKYINHPNPIRYEAIEKYSYNFLFSTLKNRDDSPLRDESATMVKMLFDVSLIEGINPDLCPYALSSYLINSKELAIYSSLCVMEQINTMALTVLKSTDNIDIDGHFINMIAKTSRFDIFCYTKHSKIMSKISSGELFPTDISDYDRNIDNTKRVIAEVIKNYNTLVLSAKMPLFLHLSEYTDDILNRLLIGTFGMNYDKRIKETFDPRSLINRVLGKTPLLSIHIAKLVMNPDLFILVVPTFAPHETGISSIDMNSLFSLPRYLFHRVIMIKIKSFSSPALSLEFLLKLLREVIGEKRLPRGYSSILSNVVIASRFILAAAITKNSGIKPLPLPDIITEFITDVVTMVADDKILLAEHEFDQGYIPIHTDPDLITLYTTIGGRSLFLFFCELISKGLDSDIKNKLKKDTK